MFSWEIPLGYSVRSTASWGFKQLLPSYQAVAKCKKCLSIHSWIYHRCKKHSQCLSLSLPFSDSYYRKDPKRSLSILASETLSKALPGAMQLQTDVLMEFSLNYKTGCSKKWGAKRSCLSHIGERDVGFNSPWLIFVTLPSILRNKIQEYEELLKLKAVWIFFWRAAVRNCCASICWQISTWISPISQDRKSSNLSLVS